MLNGVVNTGKDYLAGVIDISEVMLCRCQLHRRSTGSIEYPCDCLKKKFTIGKKRHMGKSRIYITHTYIIHCAFTVYFASWLVSVFLFFVRSNLQFKHSFHLTFSSATLFNHCLIIIQLLFDYCSVFWYWKCIPIILIPITTTICRVNKHHTSARFAYFRLNTGFLKAYCHYRC